MFPAMSELAVSVLPAISGIDAAEWDGCGAGANPFTTHRFLSALEQSGSVGDETGWHPSHLVARLDGQVAGVAPCYVKTHSQGEYIFDHGWAQAYERAGGRYYPKLQCAVPFTPVSGPRLIASSPAVQRALLAAWRNSRSNRAFRARMSPSAPRPRRNWARRPAFCPAPANSSTG